MPKTFRRLFLGLLAAFVVLASVTVGYLLAKSEPKAPTVAIEAAPPREPIKQPEAAETLSPKVAPTQTPAIKDISLGELSEADGNELDPGCMGAFTAKQKTVLMVSGGLLIFRPDGKRILAPVIDADFEAFGQDDAVYSVQGYRLTLRARGQTKPGFDGHSVAATLTISKGTQVTSYVGNWGFGC